MRPKLLEIEGLQSFRERQSIDFDQLGETGLFGIFGPTGSGKSTILDAITFALYGRVKRAERGTQGIIHSNLSAAKVSFTFELLKDGCRRTFRVERTYQRKKGSDNSCEPKVVRLIEMTQVGETPVSDKASEVSNSIEELLGLSHDDFTRAVVLPQNSFQEFLLLDNAKKREMLERIFYLEEYGKQLWEKLSRRIFRLKSRIDRLSGELSAYGDASDEALEEAQRVMIEAASEKARVEKELKGLEVRYNEAKEVWHLIQELSFVNQKERQQMSLKEAVHEKKVQLEKALKADSLLEIIDKNKELSSKLLETENQLQAVMDKLPAVLSVLDENRGKYETIKHEAATEQPRLVGLKTRLLGALEIEKEVKNFREKINELQTAATRLKEDISNKNMAAAEETESYNVMEQSLGKLDLEVKNLTIDPEYRQQIQEAARLENEVETLKKNAKELNLKVEELNDVVSGLEKRLEQIKKEISQSQKWLETLISDQKEHELSRLEDRNAVLQYKEKYHELQSLNNVLKFRQNELDAVDKRLAEQHSSLEKKKKKC